MSLTFAIALYFVIWWTILFAVLPLGVKSQIEEGRVVPGSEGAAPARPLLLMKAGITSIVAAVILAAFWVILEYQLIALDDLPFGPKFGS
jgi:predicted secreted protein